MTAMGRYSPPIDGTMTANGHALAPFTIPLRESGPVSALPQQICQTCGHPIDGRSPHPPECAKCPEGYCEPRQGDPGQPRTVPDKTRRWALAMSAFRRNWWRLVFASVGAVAAVVSYGHIVNLFLSWHASSLDAHLMPIAIDGLIIIGAGAARGGQKWLGWSAIGPGLAASLYANVMNGLPYGRGAAMGSGWATVALFLATNVMERWKAAPVVAPRHDSDHDKGDKPQRKQVTRKQAPAMTKQAKAAVVIRDNPGMTNAELAAIAGVDVRTIQRARNAGSTR